MTLSFNHNGPMLIIFLPWHPHLLEWAETWKDRATYPGRQLFVNACVDFHFYVLRCYLWNLFLESFEEVFDMSISSCDDHVLEEVSPYVHIGLVNWFDCQMLNAHESRKVVDAVEHPLWNGDPLLANFYLSAVWEIVGQRLYLIEVIGLWSVRIDL